MGYKVVPTVSFELNYESILLYLVDILDAPSAASRLSEEIDSMFKCLSVTPEICAISTKPTLELLELREYFVRNYVVLYRIEGDTVYLEHMFHGSQNFEAYV